MRLQATSIQRSVVAAYYDLGAQIAVEQSGPSAEVVPLPINANQRDYYCVSAEGVVDAPAAVQTHYFAWSCAIVAINAFIALLMIKLLSHTTGVCTGSGPACNASFLALGRSREIPIVIESLVWAAADVGLALAWISRRREALRLKRLENIQANR
jgi:hypothetical protein